jgi:hypothetical protein
MEEKIINGVTIYVKDGIKKRQKGNKNRYELVCIEENCSNFITFKNNNKRYCQTHYVELANTEEERQKIINEIYKKEEEKNKEKLKSSMILINNIEIYVIHDKKRRKNNYGILKPACEFKDCCNFAISQNSYKYCHLHTNGLDPNSSEKQAIVQAKRAEMKIRYKDNTKIGDDTEKWLYYMMHIFSQIHSIKRIGQNCSKLDIIYKFGNEAKYRGIQVKTLIKCERDGSYRFSNLENYDQDTLIIGINKERTRYVLLFFKDVLENKPRFGFKAKDSKYSQYMYIESLKFLTDLEKLLSKSTIYDENASLSETCKKELQSMKRLEKKCQESNLTFKLNETHASPIDCYINYYNIQCKATTVKVSNCSYKIFLQKNGGKINGKQQNKAYSDKDKIDFFVLEILDYPNQFYIIPIKELVQRGYIKTDQQEGKLKFNLSIPDIDKEHWTKKYLNNFGPLKVDFMKI